MSKQYRDPIRLRDVPSEFDTSGVRASELFSAASVQPRFHDAQVELLLRRTRAVQSASRWGRLRLLPALTSLPVLLVGMTVGAATTVMISRHWRTEVPVVQPRQVASHHVVANPRLPARKAATALQVPSNAEPSPLAAPSPAIKQVVTRKAVRHEEAPPPPVLEAAPPEQPVAPSPSTTEAWALPSSAEAQLLRQAVRTLRIDRRPALALDMLEQFGRAYPQSDLSIETRTLSAEAHLALGQRKEALAELSAVHATRNLPTELALLRAELLADAHRCAEASAAFMRLANVTLLSAQQERVLYGRAVCLAEEGDSAGARAAYLKYQNSFPHGRFAQSVARALGATNGLETSP